MNILNQSEIFNAEGISKIEKLKKATYICETCIRNKSGGWANTPVAIFYNPVKHSRGSHWFGMFVDHIDRLMITNAISAIGVPMSGVVADNGDVIYSRYRHDYRNSPDGSAWIDGGRDYTRSGGKGPYVTLKIIKDKLEIVDPRYKQPYKG